ncbi:hypothetical protein FJY68_05280 [candidate division WOR-3 bacterium]|uniref:Uncharacterized protein n=1 Tax=candidate division WOR-3 bacterium TaxID=2052148 RepID=A0A937XDW9_UNCW3|nr:hypothetical protein [candidate division WOR-3 bacterium]
MRNRTDPSLRKTGRAKLPIWTAFLALALVNCHTQDPMPCPVYMANQSGYSLCIEISQTQEFCECTEVFYFMDDSDSLFLGYYPDGYAFWLWGWIEEDRDADTTFSIDYPVHVTVAGRTLLLLDDSLGVPVLRVVH